MSILNSNLIERLLFTLIVIGLLAGLYSAVKLVDISSQLNNNMANQVHEDGSNLNLQSNAEGRMLYASDLERRQLLKERSQTIMIGGIGIALLGVGWFGYDLLNGRRKKKAQATIEAEAPA